MEAILEAAARVFAEDGFEAASTDAIAARAGTSVGSIYQFFPNKLALFEALAARCLERQRQIFDQLFAAAGARSWGEILDLAIDGFSELRERDASFAAVLANSQLYAVFEKADVALTRYFIAEVAKLARRHARRATPAERRLIATTVVNTVTGALLLSHREAPRFRRRLLAETKLMLRRYIAAYTD